MTPRRFRTQSAMLAFLRSRPATVYSVVVEHDPGCSARRCACKPYFVVRAATTENLAEAAARQAAWAKASAS